MLILIILFLLSKATCLNYNNDVGSVLFYKRNAQECWIQDDLLKLQARQIFENILLPSLPPDKVNAKYYRDTIKYFKNAMRFVDSTKDSHNKLILKEALADTLGGYMTQEILPNARFAYYAGYIPYRSAKDLHNFYESLKNTLNTQGFGWKRPRRIPFQSNFTVRKILIGAGRPFDPCSSLIIKRYQRNCIQIPSPLVDNEAHPAAISLPFKSGGLVSLNSPSSENVLLKYYTTAARCILRRSPQECRHGDFVNFNNELWHWMKRYVAPHLMDENLYAGYGGVLRIAAAVQNYGKGLSRRNLYEDFDQGSTNLGSNIDRKFTFTFNTSTPMSCAYLVLLAAAMICFLHVFYTWICGPAGGCSCASRRSPRNKDFVLNYANVETVHPQSTNRVSTETAKGCPFIRNTRSTSMGTSRTQKVYDLNENKEKVMSIVMSDEELSETEKSSSEDCNLYSQRTPVSRSAVAQQRSRRSRTHIRRSPAPQQRSQKSPPKIEATVAQLKIERTPQKTRLDSNTPVCTASTVERTPQRTLLHSSNTLDFTSTVERTPQKTPLNSNNTPIYTTSTVTQSEISQFVHGSEASWTGSYTSENTGSSLSIRSETLKSRSAQSRSLARRTTTTKHIKSTSITDLDQSSFVTSIKRRK
ncbi:hypothetical protein O0L34_g8307 [Tuta absoluta]|nr:hypothetical protein O0L34_g8307 [Tuta absoluta]